jgi:hypothetical protein
MDLIRNEIFYKKIYKHNIYVAYKPVNISIKKGKIMVKINISIEGEDISEIVGELLNIGVEIVKSNREEIREVMKILGDEALDVLMERKMLERGAQLYKKINSEINWSYKHEKK